MIKKWLTKEIIEGVGRHLLTVIAGLLIAKGYASHEQISSLGDVFNSDKLDGAVAALLAISHSIGSKTKVAQPAAPTSTDNKVTDKIRAGAPVVALLFCLFAFSSNAQQTNELPKLQIPAIGLNVTSNQITAANDLLSWFEPLIPSLTNRNVSVDLMGNYHNKVGFSTYAEYNISTNFAIGAGPELIDNTFYINAGSAKLSTDVNLPVIGKLNVALISGISISTKGYGVGSETMTRYFKEFDLYKGKLTFDAEGGIGYNSVLTGTIKEFGGRFNFNW